MAPLLSVIKIGRYCGVVGGGGALVALKSYKHNGAPSLSLILLSIVTSGEGGGGAKILQKIMTPIKINKYCGVGGVCGGGGRALGRRWNSIKDNGALSLCVIMINKYCGQKYILLINNIIVYCLSPTDACELQRIFCKFTIRARKCAKTCRPTIWEINCSRRVEF